MLYNGRGEGQDTEDNLIKREVLLFIWSYGKSQSFTLNYSPTTLSKQYTYCLGPRTASIFPPQKIKSLIRP